MYELLFDFCKRPEPFSRYTAKELWTKPHLAKQMLDFHLSQATDLASRRIEFIDQAVEWIDDQIDLTGKAICDLGCGPGLYAERFTAKGAEVTGVDFSSHSLGYAERHGSRSVRYIEADYLLDDLPSGFDLVSLIYTDLCSLSSMQRRQLLQRMRSMLNPGGHIVLDVAGIASLNARKEETVVEYRMMDGFWAPDDYIGMKRTLVYMEESLSLDHYLIVQPNEIWQIFNWAQHFTPTSIEKELRDAGFLVDHMAGDLSGAPLEQEGDLIAVVARRV